MYTRGLTRSYNGAIPAGLLTSSFRRDLGRFAVAPAAEPLERRGTILALGALPADTESELRRLEIEVVRVTTTLHALENMATLAFHAVVLSPEIAGALDLVKQVKEGREAADVDLDLVWQAASRNMLTPIVVLPFARDDEYAVIVAPPKVAFLERTGNVPLLHALHLDVASLVATTPRN